MLVFGFATCCVVATIRFGDLDAAVRVLNVRVAAIDGRVSTALPRSVLAPSLLQQQQELCQQQLELRVQQQEVRQQQEELRLQQEQLRQLIINRRM
ncbi:hypothetical protein COHA_010670 [Chlorella ohadii]|uniref:Uncharacterized protein n=1 Tax=Chlorella ohadii TaxID=2649997 RepID=A0AAD5DFL5_9CHLO|nr:hypothetical protein COHA_010670 [Chlorella ohadii]